MPASLSGSVHSPSGRVVRTGDGLERVRHLKASGMLFDLHAVANHQADLGDMLGKQIVPGEGDALINVRAQLTSDESAALLWVAFLLPFIPYPMRVTVEADLVRFAEVEIPPPSQCACLAALEPEDRPTVPDLEGVCSEGPLDQCFEAAHRLERAVEDGPDLDPVVEAYQQACRRGLASACFNLAVLHLQGRVVRPDDVLAERLLGKACRAQLEPACDALDQLRGW